MLLETGQVEKITKPGRALTLIRRASSCKSCSARGACMTLGGTERTIEVRDPVGAAVGDEVEIGIQPSRVVWASTVAYIFPVIGMILGALLGFSLAPEGMRDEVAAGGSFGALAICFGVIWFYDRYWGDRENRVPVVVRVLRNCGGGDDTD